MDLDSRLHSSIKKCSSDTSVAIFLPSAAAIDRTVKTEEVDTVGAAKSS
jgi:hypothetical protein